MSDSVVIIPTYNEKENIENIIRAVTGLEKEFHVLIIDDGSPDGTGAIVKRMQQEMPDRLFLIGASFFVSFHSVCQGKQNTVPVNITVYH